MIPRHLAHGTEWGYVYAKTDSRLSEEDRNSLVMTAIDMLYEEQDKKDVLSDSYEGRIQDTGKSYNLGAFFGKLFEVNIEFDFGKTRLSFLVLPYKNPALN